MRRRSFAGPLILILIGVLFLIYNLRPQIPLFDLVAIYWPFLLIAWGTVRLAEVLVAWFRNERPGNGFGGGEVVLVILICLVGSGLFAANRHGIHFRTHGLDMFGEEYEYTISGQTALTNIKSVVIDNPRGNLQITGGDATDLQVSGRKSVRAFGRSDADQADRNSPLEFVPQGNQMVIRTNQDRAGRNLRVIEDLIITLPRGVAVSARGGNGEYEISDIASTVDVTGERADVRLNRIGGNVRIEMRRSDLIRAIDLKGNLDLQGRGTDITLENIAGQVTINGSYSGSLEFKNVSQPLHFESPNTDLRVEALPGQITMDLGELTGQNLVGPVRFVTRSKDVKLEGFTNSAEIETDRGDIELDPGKAVPRISARSRAGRIELALPAKASFQLDATAQRGDAENDFGPELQKESDGRSATLRGKVGQGPSIVLVTERGSVTVKKAGAMVPAEAKL